MKPSKSFAAIVLMWPSVACASFTGPLYFSFGSNVVFGILGALPGAIAILLLEWKGATRRPPVWLGAVAALAAVYCVLRLTGLVGLTFDGGIFILPLPPLIELILITFVTSSRVRHAAGWAVAAASILIFALAAALEAPLGTRPSNESWGLLCGGALTTCLLWRLGFSLGQRAAHRTRT